MNNIIELIETLPDKPWTWEDISANPGISLKYIDDHPEFPWEIKNVGSYNGNGLSENPNLTMKYVLDHMDLKWDWSRISSNSGITLQDIEDNLQLPWEWELIARNPNITLDFILKHIDHYNTRGTAHYLGRTKNITLENIQQHPELFFNGSQLSDNPNLTVDYIKSVDDRDQIFYRWISMIGSKRYITFSEIMNWKEVVENDEYFDKIIQGFSHNTNLTRETIDNNLNLNWCWMTICINPAITIQDIEYYKNTIETACANHIIELQNYNRENGVFFDIRDYDRDYIHEAMSVNPNLDAQYVIDHADEKWAWDYLSGNPFKYHKYFEEEIVIRI